jgi:hypothetical protein
MDGRGCYNLISKQHISYAEAKPGISFGELYLPVHWESSSPALQVCKGSTVTCVIKVKQQGLIFGRVIVQKQYNYWDVSYRPRAGSFYFLCEFPEFKVIHLTGIPHMPI